LANLNLAASLVGMDTDPTTNQDDVWGTVVEQQANLDAQAPIVSSLSGY